MLNKTSAVPKYMYPQRHQLIIFMYAYSKQLTMSCKHKCFQKQDTELLRRMCKAWNVYFHHMVCASRCNFTPQKLCVARWSQKNNYGRRQPPRPPLPPPPPKTHTQSLSHNLFNSATVDLGMPDTNERHSLGSRQNLQSTSQSHGISSQ